MFVEIVARQPGELFYLPARNAFPQGHGTYQQQDRFRVDPVDWVESIPLRETQTYVMRVAESLPIYRARLTGQTGPVDFTAILKGQ